MALPPWLNISPMDYLRAVQAGTQAGLSIRQANERAFEAAQRMEMEREAQAQRERQIGVENAANRLAQERLEAYRQGELKNAQTRLALGQQGLVQRQTTDEEKMAAARERQADLQAQRESQNETQGQLLDLKRQLLDRPRAPHYFKVGDKQYRLDEGSDTPIDVSPKSQEQGPTLVPGQRASLNPLRLTDAMGITSPPLVVQPRTNSASKKLKYVRDENGNLVPDTSQAQ